MASFLFNHCKTVFSLRLPVVCGGKALASSFSSTAAATGGAGASTSKDKVYELRTYSIVPSKMPDVMKLLGEFYDIRRRHSKLIGFWCTELGGINEVVHMWEYDSYAHRAVVRKGLAEDQEWWDKCLSKLLPMFQNQTNVFLRPFSWYQPTLEPAKGFGCYELKHLKVKPGMLPQLEHRMQQGLPERLEIPPAPLGLFYSEFGPMNSMYALGQYVNFDHQCEHRKAVLTNEDWRHTYGDMMKFLDGIEIKALVPAPFSPLQ